MSKKIVFLVVSDLRPGGAQKQILILAEKLKKHYEIYLITWQSNATDFYSVGSDIQRITLSSLHIQKLHVFGYLFRIIKMRKKIKEISPNIIISFLPEISAMTLIANYKTKIPIVSSVRHHPANEKISLRNKFYYLITINRLITVFQNQDIANWFKNKYNFSLPFYVINNFLDNYNYFVKQSSIQVPFQAEGFLLAVGTKLYQKGFDLLLEAYDNAVEMGVNKKLVIIGIEDKIERKKLNKLLEKSKNNQEIFIFDYISNIEDWIRNSYCFILSSRFEGTPNILIEVLKNKKATIAFDCPSGPKSMLHGGRYGMLVKNINVSDLAYAILGLVKNQELRDTYERRLIDHESLEINPDLEWIRIIEEYRS